MRLVHKLKFYIEARLILQEIDNGCWKRLFASTSSMWEAFKCELGRVQGQDVRLQGRFGRIREVWL